MPTQLIPSILWWPVEIRHHQMIEIMEDTHTYKQKKKSNPQTHNGLHYVGGSCHTHCWIISGR